MTNYSTLKNLIQNEVLITDYKQIPADDFETPGWIFDFRKILLNPENLSLITDLLYEKIGGLKAYQIAGLESAAIPLVTSLTLKGHANGDMVSGFYIRKSRKKSGLNKTIEGELSDQPIILVDDLINSSTSIMKQVQILKEFGKTVSQVIVIVRFRDEQYYRETLGENVAVKYLFTLDQFGLKNTSDTISHIQYPSIWSFVPKNSTHSLVTPRSTPIVYNNSLLFGSDDTWFRSISIHTGIEQWSIRTGPSAGGKSVLSSPTIANDTVYFGSYDGKLYALDAENGVCKWIFTECEWIGSSPCVSTKLNLLFVGLEHGNLQCKGSLIALNLATGERVWEYLMPALTHASPLLLDEYAQVAIGSNDGILYLFDAQSGGLIWQYETEGGKRYPGHGGYSLGDIKMSPAYDNESDQIAFCSMDGYLYVVDRQTGTLSFRVASEYADTTTRIGIYSSPIFYKDTIIFSGLDKVIYCVNKLNGELIWKVRTSGRIFSTPMVKSDVVFIGSNDGILYEIEANKGRVLGKRQYQDRIVCPVVFYQNDGREIIVIRTNNGSIYAGNYSALGT